MKKQTIILLIFSFILGFFSCDDKEGIIIGKDEEEQPEELLTPITIDELDSIAAIAYPRSNYGWICELSSDNLFDNQVPYYGNVFPTTLHDPMDEELYTWQDVITTSSVRDTPSFMWEKYYGSVTEANRIINHIEITEGTEDYKTPMASYKGEAYLLRAYCHFILVNLFAQPYKDASTSMSDMAIPYHTSADSLSSGYQVVSVKEVYDNILEDINTGMELLVNDKVEKTKYRFNIRSAHALAARVNLYVRNYQKVIEHADVVLGSNPSSSLRDWNLNLYEMDEIRDTYYSTDNKANLFLLDTYSLQMRRNSYNPRYGYIRDALKGSCFTAGPTWSGRCYFVMWANVYTYNQNYSLFLGNLLEYFEYTDEEMTVGYAHILRAEFTTGALLLDRAEAHAMLKNKEAALRDLEYWNKAHLMSKQLTDEIINTYYTSETAHEDCVSFPFNTDKMAIGFTVPSDIKPYIDCVLHFRRIDRTHFGERWFDIKRYGIEPTKTIGEDARIITLAWDNPQRALDIPVAIPAGKSKINPSPYMQETTNRSSLNELHQVETISR